MEGKKKFNKQDYDNQYIKAHKDRINFLMEKGTKERLEYWEIMMDNPELLPSEQDQRDTLEQWRGAHFILRNLGIEL